MKGLCRLVGTKFIPVIFPDANLENTQSRFSTICIWSVIEDRQGNIWFSSEGYGVYRFAGDKLTNYSVAEGLGVKAVQVIFRDNSGRLWVGGGGLYRFEEGAFINVKKNGP